MIYLDTCFLLKCYLTEHGSPEVRRLTQAADGLASCDLARIEFAAAVHRHQREGKLEAADAAGVLDDFETDQAAGLWQWLGLTQSLMDTACCRFRNLDAGLFLRTNDALHLTCAQENGFRRIYSSDRHVLAAASAFGLQGVNVVP